MSLAGCSGAGWVLLLLARAPLGAQPRSPRWQQPRWSSESWGSSAIVRMLLHAGSKAQRSPGMSPSSPAPPEGIHTDCWRSETREIIEMRWVGDYTLLATESPQPAFCCSWFSQVEAGDEKSSRVGPSAPDPGLGGSKTSGPSLPLRCLLQGEMMVDQRVFCAPARGDGGAGRSLQGWDRAPFHLPDLCSAPAAQSLWRRLTSRQTAQ